MEETIRIGTLVPGNRNCGSYIRQILPYGFESFAVNYQRNFGDCPPEELSKIVLPELKGKAVVSALCVYGNPLESDELSVSTLRALERAIDTAHLFGTDIVAGFTGRLINVPIDKNMERFKEVWTPLAERAAKRNVRIAFENCGMGGDWGMGSWNIAHNPDAWELMFDAVPAENMGLQWEPCHQMYQLIDPMPQIARWGHKFFHLHGKDANVLDDVVRTHGVKSKVPYCYHRTPGFGDCNWAVIIGELRKVGFKGAIDIEGWHDPVYRGDLEMTGQVYGLNYLKGCRAPFVPNPAV